MVNRFVFVFLLMFSLLCRSQYRFEGHIQKDFENKTAYLSIIEDYRKFSRINHEQIIKKSVIDSLGFFKFTGNDLPKENRIYRIHIDDCTDQAQNPEHFLGQCENIRSILFIANNHDVVSFPPSFEDEVLCEITSTNPNSIAFLKIDTLKEEMAIDFSEINSTASKKLNSKKWFSKLQHFGESLNEPLAELYIYDFLSDKRSETYSFYLQNLSTTDYYYDLSKRLENNYPNAPFTKHYNQEISADQLMTSRQTSGPFKWIWILGILLFLSLAFNSYSLLKQRSTQEELKKHGIQKLTAQEQKIVGEILNEKTNKEIASTLFISQSTVKTHINNLYKKLGVSSREEIKQRF